MNAKQILLEAVLVGFSALTAVALYQHGVVEFADLLMANWATLTISVDLVIALSMVSVWVYADARDRGISPLPYLLLTVTLGSVGPLLYLVRREAFEARELAAAA